MTTWFPWVIFIASIVMLVVLAGSTLFRKAKTIRAVVLFLLAAMAGAALAEIVLGELLARGMQVLAGLIGGPFGMPLTALLALVAFLMVFAIIVWSADGHVDKREIVLILLLPTVFVAASGLGITGEGSQLAASFLEVGANLFGWVVS